MGVTNKRLAAQIEQGAVASLDEVNHALNQHIMATATMGVGGLASVVLSCVIPF